MEGGGPPTEAGDSEGEDNSTLMGQIRDRIR